MNNEEANAATQDVDKELTATVVPLDGLVDEHEELVSVEGLGDSLGQPVDPGLLDEARRHTGEAWISLQRLIAQI